MVLFYRIERTWGHDFVSSWLSIRLFPPHLPARTWASSFPLHLVLTDSMDKLLTDRFNSFQFAYNIRDNLTRMIKNWIWGLVNTFCSSLHSRYNEYTLYPWYTVHFHSGSVHALYFLVLLHIRLSCIPWQFWWSLRLSYIIGDNPLTRDFPAYASKNKCEDDMRFGYVRV